MTGNAVVGAGIPGLTAASNLTERGRDVTPFDRDCHAAMQIPFDNGRQLSAFCAQPDPLGDRLQGHEVDADAWRAVSAEPQARLAGRRSAGRRGS